ncbi:MAG TPA: hypothetical protein H9676_07850 [Firmicutes bacterium]|nr:hypothetical protein [Bacillota bacterium]
MSVLNELLEYQKVDAQMRRIEQEVAASDEQKKFAQANKFMKSAPERFEAQDRRAAELAALREDLVRRAEDISKQIAEYSELDEMVEEGGDVSFYKKNAQTLLDRLRALKGEMQKLNADIAATVEEYERFKKQGAAMQKQYKEYKAKRDELVNNRKDEVNRLKAQLKSIAEKIPAETLAKYQQKRKENIFPIVVPLNGNMCVCGMDFPIALQERLAGGNVVECEHCRRFVYKK